MDLSINSQQWLICHEIKPNQKLFPIKQKLKLSVLKYSDVTKTIKYLL